MSEKEQLPPDNISLPPNYAPSETYTESPPPAYRKEKSAQVYVARMVCLTVISAALLTGFFITFSSWLNARACHCETHHSHKHSDPIQSASLVGIPAINEVSNDIEGQITNEEIQSKVNNDKLMNNDIINPDQSLEALEEKVVNLEKIEGEVEEGRKLLEGTLKGQLDSLKKKIKLPIDMLLGNPALSGKDVQCEVEKRVHDMGGIAAQAIIVTCKDEDDETPLKEGQSKFPFLKQSGAVKPPLSFLAPIMKMIAARAKAERLSGKMNKPNIVIHPLSGSVPRPLENHGPMFPQLPEQKRFMNQNSFIPVNQFNMMPPSRPMKELFPKIIESGTMHNPIRRFDAGPMNGPIINGNIVRKAFNGPTPNIIDGELMNQILSNLPLPNNANPPIIRIEERRAFPPFPFNNGPMPFMPLPNPPRPLTLINPISNQIGPMPPHLMQHNMNLPMPGNIINREMPHNHMHGDFPHNHMHGDLPHKHFNRDLPHNHINADIPHNHINGDRPHNHMNVGSPQHMEGARPMPFHHMNEPQLPNHPRNNRVLEPSSRPEPIVGPIQDIFPFPLPKNVIPLKQIKQEEEEPRRTSKMIKLFPFNIRPLRLISSRKSRLLTPDAPYPEPKPEIEVQNIPDFTQLARGIQSKQNEDIEPEVLPEDLPHPVPEASGRALPEPVSLPKIRLLPGRLLRLPLAPSLQMLPEIIQKRIITHMEMRNAPDLDNTDEDPNQPHHNLQPPGVILPPINNEEPSEFFGPPKDHSLMEDAESVDNDTEIEFSESILEDSQVPNFPPDFPHNLPLFSAKHPNPPFIPADFPPPPPPPHMDPEGKTGIIPEINPDSEIISLEPIEAKEPIIIESETVPEAENSEDKANNRHVILLN